MLRNGLALKKRKIDTSKYDDVYNRIFEKRSILIECKNIKTINFK